ncbi:MAG: VTT domain-containing protein [Bacteroidia bacterium]|nr:VTT domain-containing protein [Bacteroidia bacterium]
MDSFWDLFKPEELIRYGGLALLLIIIVIENGIFFGFFLPGDSLLFTAGLLCYLNVLDVDLAVLEAGIAAAAIAGYYFGYYFGYKTGEALYKRPDSLFFKKQYIYTAENFYKKYGGIALIMGRFLPIVRTFAPILAGVVKVNGRIFLMYNILGAILWPGVVVTAGYFVGSVFPNALNYLNYIVIAFIVVTAIPVINNLRNQKKTKSL